MTNSPIVDVFVGQLKSFGAKLKEKNNFFRKASKVRSHQMKEALYSDLVQANQVLCRQVAPVVSEQGRLWTCLCFQAEQQSLIGMIEKADEMIRSLDGCVGELEAGMWPGPCDDTFVYY